MVHKSCTCSGPPPPPALPRTWVREIPRSGEEPRKQAQAVQSCSRSRVRGRCRRGFLGTQVSVQRLLSRSLRYKVELLPEPAEPPAGQPIRCRKPCTKWKHELNSKRLYKVEPRLDDNYDSKNSPSARKELRLRGVPIPQNMAVRSISEICWQRRDEDLALPRCCLLLGAFGRCGSARNRRRRDEDLAVPRCCLLLGASPSPPTWASGRRSLLQLSNSFLRPEPT